jgi:thiol:disulfide interchange protein DsbA
MRKFVKYGVWLILCLQMVDVCAVESVPFTEGKQYIKASEKTLQDPLVQTLVKENPGSIQVLEFFSYGCHWCYKLEPAIETWRKAHQKKVVFQRVPVEFQAAWGPLTKAYYTALALKAMDKIHAPFFEAIQTQKITRSDEETLRQFFVKQGVDEKAFKQTFASMDIVQQQQWANAISRAYQITSVPMLIVQGPKGIYLTSITMAGSEEEVIKVLQYLINMQS